MVPPSSNADTVASLSNGRLTSDMTLFLFDDKETNKWPDQRSVNVRGIA